MRFRILDTQVAPDWENLFVRVDLVLENDEHDVEPEEIERVQVVSTEPVTN